MKMKNFDDIGICFQPPPPLNFLNLVMGGVKLCAYG